ncbi:F-box/kelch-repeat protein At3g23880-like isoform X1 [Euphorbia lathyris]|uniref:F-box/kelch-repeat protein At3g23880-like isoform X1 n=2 Tax=Euphorbia lathyris TaxID=212925 RepID=UPI0033143565
MQSGRISLTTNSNAKRDRTMIGEVSLNLVTQPSFSYLPKDIVVTIILRLSIKTIFIFKSVCKTWYDIVSDPEFAKVRFDQGEVYPLIQTSLCRQGSKMVYLVQPDKDDFELKLGMCDHYFFKRGCVCNLEVKIDTKFEIPEKYSQYGATNSCNGLLCLLNKCDKWLCPIVCNPIMGEFINLPTDKIELSSSSICYGFGFSPTTNQYTVIRMFHHDTHVSNKAEVHILGTKTWKEIDIFNQSIPKSFTTYLNGFIYWSSNLQSLSIFSFDVGEQGFGSVPSPAINDPYAQDSVGVLGGELCITAVLEYGAIHVWTMKDNSTDKGWSKVYSFDYIYCNLVPHYGCFQPIKYLDDGALLMFFSSTEALVYMDPIKHQFKYLNVHSMSKVEAIAYIPNFVSLKHILSGQNAKVHKVKSRCAKLKLHSETDVDIIEQRFYPDFYY